MATDKRGTMLAVGCSKFSAVRVFSLVSCDDPPYSAHSSHSPQSYSRSQRYAYQASEHSPQGESQNWPPHSHPHRSNSPHGSSFTSHTSLNGFVRWGSLLFTCEPSYLSSAASLLTHGLNEPVVSVSFSPAGDYLAYAWKNYCYLVHLWREPTSGTSARAPPSVSFDIIRGINKRKLDSSTDHRSSRGKEMIIGPIVKFNVNKEDNPEVCVITHSGWYHEITDLVSLFTNTGRWPTGASRANITFQLWFIDRPEWRPAVNEISVCTDEEGFAQLN
eukprot:GHVN01085396.1.p1 GENE.GHVN01085396.1~~GHVN01085396.1.p1  ORF type:complete len:314 (-),score=79.14 GHVN01085396.1:107-931(-)